MSKSARWKLDRTKVKVVFRLQFHATNIPQSGWDKLFVSLVPADSGKVTAKTTRANVRNGSCKWADPIYETTKLLQDAKTKMYEDMFYKLIVATGSSRSSLLGEATINLANYADASKPTVVTLPLHGSDTGAVLNVTVQLLSSKTGFREFEQQRELSEKRLQTNGNDAGNILASRDYPDSLLYKVNARIKFKRDTGELLEASLNKESPDLASGVDGTSNTSENLYVEKHEGSSVHEIEGIRSTVSGDFGGLSLSQSSRTVEEDLFTNQSMTPRTRDWIHSQGSDPSEVNELQFVYQDYSKLHASFEVAELSIHELKLAMNMLQSYADDISAEMHKLAEELSAEIACGQGLTKEVSFLKSECERLKGVVEWLRNSNTVNGTVLRKNSDTNQHCIRHEPDVGWIEGLVVLEDKIRELQNKAFLAFHEKDFRFLVSDLGALVTIIDNLKQGKFASQLASVPAASAVVGKFNEINLPQVDGFLSGTSFGLDLCHPDVLQCVSVPELVSRETGSSDAASDKHEELFKLIRELDESKAEREGLVTKMDQMECYYETLIQELEENQKRMLGEYQNIRNEHSSCIYTISSAKAQMEVLHQSMSEKILRLEKERCELDSLSKEMERRAITSEAALKRFKLNYSIAVNQLQKDLEMLSFQVLSMYETNENLIREAFSEALQPCFLGYPDIMCSNNVDARDSNTSKPISCQNPSVEAESLPIGEEILLDDLRNSLALQEERYQEIEEELYEHFLTNIQLDVFAQILKHSLQESIAEIRLEKESLHTLMELLAASTKSNQLLKNELQTAADSISVLAADKAIYVAKCNDLSQQNQILEAKCRSLCDEISKLVHKTAELEATRLECKTYKSSYEACDADRKHLMSLYEHSTLENGKLSDDNIVMKEELNAVKTELDRLASSKESLQKMVDYLIEKLETSSGSFCEQLQLSLCDKSLALPELDHDNFEGIISWSEEVHHMSLKIIHQLMQDNKVLKDECNLAQLSLSTTKHEVEVVKQKFEHEVPDMVLKLDASSTLVKKMQDDLENIGNRLKVCTEVEANYAVVNEVLSSNLTRLEIELHELTLKNGDLLQQILALGGVSQELESTKLVLAELTQHKEDLTTCLQHKADECVLLDDELNYLKGFLKSLSYLLVEKGFKSALLCEASDVNFHLNFQQHVAEVIDMKQILSELQVEKSSLLQQLSQIEESQRQSLLVSTAAEMYSTNLEESLLASDVNLAFFRMQYDFHIQDLLQQLESRDRQLQDLSNKHLSLYTMFNDCVAAKLSYAGENEKLLLTLESLKSELQISTAQSKALEDRNSDLSAELEECKTRSALSDHRYTEDCSKQEFKIEQLGLELASCLEVIDYFVFSNQELEIQYMVLKEKLDENCSLMNSLQQYNDELTRLQQRCDELNHRLCEQTFKTEEFRNLSIHLKECKDKAEEECLQVHQKREAEGASVAKHESLRIAFIKEQYDGKLEELRHQLFTSKKHSEEMLLKLQDAVDQLEKSKKSEAFQIKRNDEMLMRISALEAELCSMLSGNREKANAYDQVKAELECSLISLECCKEEKQKLKDYLQECNEKKSRIEAQFSWMRETVGRSGKLSLESESSASTMREFSDTTSVSASPPRNHKSVEYLGLKESVAESGILVSDAGEHSRETTGTYFLQMLGFHQDVLIPRAARGSLEQSNGEKLLENDVKDTAHVFTQLKAQSLMPTINYLHNELEKMKTENSAPLDYIPLEPNTAGLHRELSQLEKVNEELGNISPVFHELPGGGNSIERLLALEFKLVDAIQANKKSTSQSQSSFLRQVTDEAAVLQCFRDINDVIKDMLDMKTRYGAMDMELQEMHKRYSQLSLQLAEVEGERQKLMMTLKNTRGSKRYPSSVTSPESSK